MTTKSRTDLINNYRIKVLAASKEATKKEIFKDLLNRLYSTDEEIVRIIDAISAGAEAAIVSIPRKDKMHRGAADTLYNRIIIEFEKDLKVTLEHAKEQLAGYLLGQFRSGEGYNFTLIASDFITWRVYSPDITQLDRLMEIREDELILNEIPSALFILTEKNAEEFYFWIDRFLFKEEKVKATLKRIEEAFGYQSAVFIESFRQMSIHFDSVKESGEVQVSYEQWKKFLSVAYGSFDASENNFLVHTYLSVFSKMLAYTVVSNDDYIDDNEMKQIIDGTIFHRYNIQNFVDTDFFYWIKNDKNFPFLKNVFRLIAQEISTFDFHEVEEDVLKGVYQELIDLDTRHSLGEYYTPDWLCEKVINNYNFKSHQKVLDPSCGSGSFLRAAIHRFKILHPDLSPEQINDNIFGIDIHPLSVQIAKTTVLLALGKEISKSKKPIHLNIIQANTLLAPEGVQDLFGKTFEMSIDREKFNLNIKIFEDVTMFDDALEVCEELAEQTQNAEIINLSVFENILKRKSDKFSGVLAEVIDSFYTIYTALRDVKEKGRDSIWKFILQNLYKPYFLAGRFDYVIGNPPWFTFSSIKNEEYQDTLNQLAVKYSVKPEKAANFPHLEIAAIFLSYCSSYFLKERGKIAFVLPRSFFSADHHDNTRSGKAKGFKLEEIWDLNGVSPLFRIPSGVLFGSKAVRKDGDEIIVHKKFPIDGLNGKTISGKLPAHNCNLKIAAPKLNETSEKWFYVKQGKSTAFSTQNEKRNSKVNSYKKGFKQGATIVPRVFYFLELTQETPPDWEDRTLNIKTADIVQTDAKKPWKGHVSEGKIESQFIFRTALSKTILPFSLYNPMLVVLPITITKDRDNLKRINLLSPDQLRKEGYLNASKWFQIADTTWNELRTEKNQNISSEKYLDWQGKLTGQNLNAPYLVLYNSSAKDANATVLIRKDLDLEFFVESTAYCFNTSNLDEAYYLTAILNSSGPNLRMKDFQAKGLFGERHVHKKILDVFYPKFDAKNPVHKRLAELSEISHTKAKNFLQNNLPKGNLSAVILGRLRVSVKNSLVVEMEEINRLVLSIIS